MTCLLNSENHPHLCYSENSVQGNPARLCCGAGAFKSRGDRGLAVRQDSLGVWAFRKHDAPYVKCIKCSCLVKSCRSSLVKITSPSVWFTCINTTLSLLEKYMKNMFVANTLLSYLVRNSFPCLRKTSKWVLFFCCFLNWYSYPRDVQKTTLDK